MKKRNLL